MSSGSHRVGVIPEQYLALGDSISIDKWTGIAGGGAASQFAAKIGCTGSAFEDRTRDGNLTVGVLEDVARVDRSPTLVTLTAGGNDLALMGRPAADILESLYAIADGIDAWECRVILNTVYDPTDGNDEIGRQLGLPETLRAEYVQLNEGIRELARHRGYLLSDLERLFLGNGATAAQNWIHCAIEPNYVGASVVAAHWLGLYWGALSLDD
jgi:lysophospholipase L1-like esterase